MREIKFRAFGFENGEMIDVDEIFFFADGTFNINEELPSEFQGKELWKLMQYTGLKDKNGKEIYEGDVVTFRGSKYPVVWNAEWAMFDPVIIKEGGETEVVGNIHENPELLKS